MPPNGNFASGHYSTGPGASGFNLVDVTSPDLMPYVPRGTKALVFLGLCSGDTPGFESAINPYKPYASKTFGFYLMGDVLSLLEKGLECTLA